MKDLKLHFAENVLDIIIEIDNHQMDLPDILLDLTTEAWNLAAKYWEWLDKRREDI